MIKDIEELKDFMMFSYLHFEMYDSTGIFIGWIKNKDSPFPVPEGVDTSKPTYTRLPEVYQIFKKSKALKDEYKII